MVQWHHPAAAVANVAVNREHGCLTAVRALHGGFTVAVQNPSGLIY